MPATSCEDILRRIPDWPVIGSFVEVEFNAVGRAIFIRGEWHGRAYDNDGEPGFALHEYGAFEWNNSPGASYKPYKPEDRYVRFFRQGSLLAVTVLVKAIPPITKTEERRVIKGLRKIIGAHGTD